MAINIKAAYPANADSPSLNYTTGSFRNDSAPEAEDGTPLEMAWANDFLGARDAILKRAGVTASGDIETADESDVLDALEIIINQAIPELSQKGYLYGGVVNQNAIDPDHDVDISAITLDYNGQSVSAELLTKRMDATFAKGFGQGGMSGTMPISGFVYFFLIQQTSTGHLDYYGDNSSSGVNTPAGWVKIRYIGARATDPSSNFIPYITLGNGESINVVYTRPITDFGPSSLTASRVAYPTSIPPNCLGRFLITAGLSSAYSVWVTYLGGPDISGTDTATIRMGESSNTANTEISVLTNGSAEIGVKASSTANAVFCINSLGWQEVR